MGLSKKTIEKIEFEIAIGREKEAVKILMTEGELSEEEAHKYVVRLVSALAKSRAENTGAKGASKIFAYLFVLGGIGLWGFTGYLFFTRVSELSSAVLVPAEVVSIIIEDASYPLLAYEIEGKTYRNKGRIGSIPSEYRVGDKVEVYIINEDPDNIMINNYSYKWLPITIFAIMASIVAGAGILGLKFGATRSKRYHS